MISDMAPRQGQANALALLPEGSKSRSDSESAMKGEQGAGEGSAHQRQNLHNFFKKNKGHDRKGFVVQDPSRPCPGWNVIIILDLFVQNFCMCDLKAVDLSEYNLPAAYLDLRIAFNALYFHRTIFNLKVLRPRRPACRPRPGGGPA